MERTIDGESPGHLLKETVARLEKHPQVTLHTAHPGGGLIRPGGPIYDVTGNPGRGDHFHRARRDRSGHRGNRGADRVLRLRKASGGGDPERTGAEARRRRSGSRPVELRGDDPMRRIAHRTEKLLQPGLLCGRLETRPGLQEKGPGHRRLHSLSRHDDLPGSTKPISPRPGRRE